MSITPEDLEQEFSLTTAVTRLDFLARRDSAGSTPGPSRDLDEDDWTSVRSATTSLDVPESLELLALGEVVARKARDRQLTGFRAALRGGASWDQVAAALGVPADEAWRRYHELLDRQERDRVLDPEAAAAARELAGPRPR